MDWTQLWQIVAVPVVSGLLGWFQNAAQDGKFTKYEILKGLETIIRMGAPGLALWLVGNGIGIDIQGYVAAAIPVAVYWLYKIFNATPAPAEPSV